LSPPPSTSGSRPASDRQDDGAHRPGDHATKEHLVEPKHYKRVYRPPGWISPVVLRGASIIGVWFPTTSGKTTTLRVEPFGRVTPAIREALDREAEAMGRFLGGCCAVRFGTV
jgi:hypothetical protein